MPNVMSPSVSQHKSLQNAFHYFNRKLFNGKLATCMINFSRKAKTNGWYCASVWFNEKRKAAEISLNPDQMHRPAIEILGTLVHEMVHHWQHEKGTAPRKSYHDREWAEKMIEVGLHPVAADGSDKMVGQKMTHVIAPNGAFDIAFREMPDNIRIPFLPVSLDLPAKAKKKAANKVKYSCPVCDCNVWGKPDLRIACLECDETMIVQE